MIPDKSRRSTENKMLLARQLSRQMRERFLTGRFALINNMRADLLQFFQVNTPQQCQIFLELARFIKEIQQTLTDKEVLNIPEDLEREIRQWWEELLILNGVHKVNEIQDTVGKLAFMVVEDGGGLPDLEEDW